MRRHNYVVPFSFPLYSRLSMLCLSPFNQPCRGPAACWYWFEMKRFGTHAFAVVKDCRLLICLYSLNRLMNLLAVTGEWSAAAYFHFLAEGVIVEREESFQECPSAVRVMQSNVSGPLQYWRYSVVSVIWIIDMQTSLWQSSRNQCHYITPYF